MLPRWFRVVVAAEIAGLVAAGILLVHLAAGGVRAAGGVISWARPHPAAPGTPSPVAVTPAATVTPRPPAGVLPAGLGALLDRGTGGEYVGEWALVQLFEAVLRDQANGLLHASARSGRGP